MTEYYSLLTTIGATKIANAIANSTTVNLTQIALGDGNGSPVNPTVNTAALVHHVYTANVNSVLVNPANAHWVNVDLSLPAGVGGWTIREFLILDDAGDAIFVGNLDAQPKPLLASGTAVDLFLRFIIEVSETSAITMTIDPNLITATQNWVIEYFLTHNVFYYTSSVTPPDYAITTNSNDPYLAHADRKRFRIKFHADGTGTDTITINGLTAKSLKQRNSVGAKINAVIKAAQFADIEYDGTDYVVLNPLPPVASTDADTVDGKHAADFILASKEGSGNGLNADTVDGKHASEFQSTSELIGEIKHFYRSSAPNRFLKANGDVIPDGSGTVQGITDDFSALYALIGDTLPDLRGEFIRGLDDSRGIDTGRTLASHQKGSPIAGEDDAINNGVFGGYALANKPSLFDEVPAGYDAFNTVYVNGGSTITGVASTFGISRPTNVAMLACIRYK